MLTKFIKKLSNNEKKWFAILIVWTMMNGFILTLSDGTTRIFWPFDICENVLHFYDYTEFITYTAFPWIGFFIYIFIKKI
jgi:hypothetical protein